MSKLNIVTADELGLLSEEEISERVNVCKSEMNKRLHDFSWKTHWEVELAYAQRELQIRQHRRRLHQDFLDREREEEMRQLREEEYLPEYEGNKIPKYVRERLEWN